MHEHPNIVPYLQVLSKTMDSTTLSPEKIEVSTVRRDEDNDEVSYSWVMHGRFFVWHINTNKSVVTCFTCFKIEHEQYLVCYKAASSQL